MRCAFFGSPEFALGPLEALLESRHSVVGVVTQPDRPAGRGLRPSPPAVKRRIQPTGIPILQPEKVNCEECYAFLERTKPDILVVVAYGGFLGERLLRFGRFPPVNVHPSLLPDLRGAAPVQWALLRGYRRTGVTVQHMVKEMDAGDILVQEEFSVGENETAQELLDRFSAEGGRLLVRALDELESGAAIPRKQNASQATFAPLLSKEQGLVDFSKTDAWTTHNQIRGLHPWPGAYSFLNGRRIKLLRSAMAREQPHLGAAGSFWLREGRLFVACREGVLELLSLQPEGKRAMPPHEFEKSCRELAPARFSIEGP